MSATLDELAKEAMVLAPDQRLALASRLLESVEPEADPGADAAWETEIARRIACFDTGQCETVPAAEVFARIRRMVPGE